MRLFRIVSSLMQSRRSRRKKLERSFLRRKYERRKGEQLCEMTVALQKNGRAWVAPISKKELAEARHYERQNC